MGLRTAYCEEQAYDNSTAIIKLAAKNITFPPLFAAEEPEGQSAYCWEGGDSEHLSTKASTVQGHYPYFRYT